jgi:hypothetical protein
MIVLKGPQNYRPKIDRVIYGRYGDQLLSDDEIHLPNTGPLLCNKWACRHLEKDPDEVK